MREQIQIQQPSMPIGQNYHYQNLNTPLLSTFGADALVIDTGGAENNSTVQNVTQCMTISNSSCTAYVQNGKYGPNDYWGLDGNNQIVQNQAKIYINNFEDGDRLSLHKSGYGFESNYQIIPADPDQLFDSKAVVKMKTDCFNTLLCKLSDSRAAFVALEVSGANKFKINEAELNKAISNTPQNTYALR